MEIGRPQLQHTPDGSQTPAFDTPRDAYRFPELPDIRVLQEEEPAVSEKPIEAFQEQKKRHRGSEIVYGIAAGLSQIEQEIIRGADRDEAIILLQRMKRMYSARKYPQDVKDKVMQRFRSYEAAILRHFQTVEEVEYDMSLYRDYYEELGVQVDDPRALGAAVYSSISGGEHPVGDITVRVEHGYIFVECTNEEDYLNALYRDADSTVERKKSGGFFHSEWEFRLDGYSVSDTVPVIVLNGTGAIMERTARHEREHYIHHVVLQQFRGLDSGVSEDERSNEIMAASTAIRDELLAYTRDGTTPILIKKVLLDGVISSDSEENSERQSINGLYVHLFERAGGEAIDASAGDSMERKHAGEQRILELAYHIDRFVVELAALDALARRFMGKAIDTSRPRRTMSRTQERDTYRAHIAYALKETPLEQLPARCRALRQMFSFHDRWITECSDRYEGSINNDITAERKNYHPENSYTGTERKAYVDYEQASSMYSKKRFAIHIDRWRRSVLLGQEPDGYVQKIIATLETIESKKADAIDRLRNDQGYIPAAELESTIHFIDSDMEDIFGYGLELEDFEDDMDFDKPVLSAEQVERYQQTIGQFQEKVRHRILNENDPLYVLLQYEVNNAIDSLQKGAGRSEIDPAAIEQQLSRVPVLHNLQCSVDAVEIHDLFIGEMAKSARVDIHMNFGEANAVSSFIFYGE